MLVVQLRLSAFWSKEASCANQTAAQPKLLLGQLMLKCPDHEPIDSGTCVSYMLLDVA